MPARPNDKTTKDVGTIIDGSGFVEEPGLRLGFALGDGDPLPLALQKIEVEHLTQQEQFQFLAPHVGLIDFGGKHQHHFIDGKVDKLEAEGEPPMDDHQRMV